MCGIAGFVGPGAAEKVMEGLRALAYRGYDSAGIAVVHDGKIHYRRRVGHLKMLADLLATHTTTCILGGDRSCAVGNVGSGHGSECTSARPQAYRGGCERHN